MDHQLLYYKLKSNTPSIGVRLCSLDIVEFATNKVSSVTVPTLNIQ